jgi:hypothetical protein
MRLLIGLGLIQVTLSVAAVIENIAVEVKLPINDIEFEGILGRDVESSHVTKRLVINDEHWCDGKIHDAAAGVYKPYSAVCNWALDRSYRVSCETADHRQSVWVQDYCVVGTFCRQLEDRPLWNGQLGYDIGCNPSGQFVKWAIGSRQIGQSYSTFCSKVYTHRPDRSKPAVYAFFEKFFGELGQQTQILYANILLNGEIMREAYNTDQLRTKHVLAPGDTIRYCGEAGSSALIEGYATAKFISWV